MTTSNELRTAAEGVLRVPPLCRCNKPGCRLHQAMQVATAYLAEHPSDDAEPLSVEWLQAVGWHLLSGMTSSMEIDPDHGEYRCRISRFVGDSGAWLFSGNNATVVISSATVRTRGDVRGPCRLLGVPLKESP